MLSSKKLIIGFFSLITIGCLGYLVYDIFNPGIGLDYCDMSSYNSGVYVHLVDEYDRLPRLGDDGDTTVRSSNGKYLNGESEGERVFMYNNGEKVIGNYINGNKDGCRVRYRSGGKIKSVENYINGMARESNWYEFYKDGEIKKITNFYLNSDGAWIQERTEYFHDGRIRSKGAFKNTLYNGKWVNYYDNGSLEYERSYIDGEFDGDYFEYYDNGQIKEFRGYDKGKSIGKWRRYDRDGNIIWKADYGLDYNMYYYDSGELMEKGKYNEEGLRDGERTRYYKNGNVIDTITYENGKIKDGEYINYDESGNVRSKIVYSGGYPFDGEYIRYDYQFRIESIEHFKNGGMKGEFTEYYFNGQVQKHGYCNSLGILCHPVGEVIEYYPDGSIKEKSEYLDGVLNGKNTQYYSNGQVERTGIYKDWKLDLGETEYRYCSDGSLLQEIKNINGNMEKTIYKESCYDHPDYFVMDLY